MKVQLAQKMDDKIKYALSLNRNENEKGRERERERERERKQNSKTKIPTRVFSRQRKQRETFFFHGSEGDKLTLKK